MAKKLCARSASNLHLLDLDVPLPALDPEAWQRATLSFRLLARDGQSRGQALHYLDASLGASSQFFQFTYPRYVALPPAGSWQLIEIPLAELRSDGALPPTPETLPRLKSVRIGAIFASWETIQLDDIAIRY